MKKLIQILLAAGVLASFSSMLFATTLDDVKKKGFVQCGVSQGTPGFSSPDSKGEWSGIDVDVCRAIAAAIFGDAKKVKYTPLSAKVRFTTLSAGEIDVLSRNTTWTASRDNSLGLDFTTVNFYDGQGFIVHKKTGIKSATELSGATICVQAGTTHEQTTVDYFAQNNMEYNPIVFEKINDQVAAYDAGRCDVLTNDRSNLAAQTVKLKDPNGHVVLPETISKEPLGPVVRQNDSQWKDLVFWSLSAMIIAEEMGVTSKNVDSMKKSNDPAIKRLLGVEDEFGQQMGVSNTWAYNIVKQVGNYGESYERNVGPNTPLKLARGVNEQWTKGGILYAPPIR